MIRTPDNYCKIFRTEKITIGEITARMREIKQRELTRPIHVQTEDILSYQEYIKRIREANPNRPYVYAECLYVAKRGGLAWYEEYKSNIRRGLDQPQNTR